jgi:hypothetical protein
MLRAILDQVAHGRIVCVGPVPQLPDLVSVSITDGDRIVEEASCSDTDAALRHVIRKLAQQLEG